MCSRAIFPLIIINGAKEMLWISKSWSEKLSSKRGKLHLILLSNGLVSVAFYKNPKSPRFQYLERHIFNNILNTFCGECFFLSFKL